MGHPANFGSLERLASTIRGRATLIQRKRQQRVFIITFTVTRSKELTFTRRRQRTANQTTQLHFTQRKLVDVFRPTRLHSLGSHENVNVGFTLTIDSRAVRFVLLPKSQPTLPLDIGFLSFFENAGVFRLDPSNNALLPSSHV